VGRKSKGESWTLKSEKLAQGVQKRKRLLTRKNAALKKRGKGKPRRKLQRQSGGKKSGERYKFKGIKKKRKQKCLKKGNRRKRKPGDRDKHGTKTRKMIKDGFGKKMNVGKHVNEGVGKANREIKIIKKRGILGWG